VEATIKLGLAISSGLGALGTAVYKVFRYTQRRLEEYRTNEKGKSAKLDSLHTTVTEMGPLLRDIQYELKANGGGSLRDVIMEIRNEHAIERTARRVMSNIASFEVRIHEEGHSEVSFVSPQYVRLTGLTRDDAEDGGWIRAVALGDRERVMAMSEASWRNGTVMSTMYTLHNVLTGEETLVEHTGTPVFNYAGVSVGWVGVLRPRTLHGEHYADEQIKRAG